ncbi:MAG: ABC transporter ATP-binding protein [Clostridiales bacterium]|nr:ABC transporter ATP-binding protein [Clostridiales bacterium]
MITIESLRFAYGGKQIFDGLNLSLGPITCVTGPSGCGKTTLLRLVAGLLKPQSGTIGGVPERVSMVFQEDRLLPWRTALENVSAVLPPAEAHQAADWLRLVELSGLRNSYPDSMSGGQKRRVALARALAYSGELPEGGGLLILDEPFKGVDPELTDRMAALILSRNIPIIAALHAPEEIERLGGDNVRLPC